MSNDHYVPGSVMGIGDTHVLLELPFRFTLQQLTPHIYVAYVNFQGKVLKMKIASTFQNYLKYLYWLYPKKNFKFCPIFSEKFILSEENLFTSSCWGEGGLVLAYSRDLWLRDILCWFKKWQSDFLSHTWRSSANSQLAGVTQVWLRLAPASLARSGGAIRGPGGGLPPVSLGLSTRMWVAKPMQHSGL